MGLFGNFKHYFQVQNAIVFWRHQINNNEQNIKCSQGGHFLFDAYNSLKFVSVKSSEWTREIQYNQLTSRST